MCLVLECLLAHPKIWLTSYLANVWKQLIDASVLWYDLWKFINVFFFSTESEEIHIISKISVQKEQTIIIPCLYEANFASSPKYLSSGPYFIFSHYVHERILILDYKTENIFTAILTDVEVSDTGYYWCGVEQSGSDHGTSLYLEVVEGKICFWAVWKLV